MRERERERASDRGRERERERETKKCVLIPIRIIEFSICLIIVPSLFSPTLRGGGGGGWMEDALAEMLEHHHQPTSPKLAFISYAMCLSP